VQGALEKASSQGPVGLYSEGALGVEQGHGSHATWVAMTVWTMVTCTVSRRTVTAGAGVPLEVGCRANWV